MKFLNTYLERLYIDHPETFIELAREFNCQDVEIKKAVTIQDHLRISEQVEKLVDAVNREIKKYSPDHHDLESFIDFVLEENVEGYRSYYPIESKLIFLVENKEELKRRVKSSDHRILLDKLSTLGKAVRMVLESERMNDTRGSVWMQVAKMKIAEKVEEGEESGTKKIKREFSKGKMKKKRKFFKFFF